MAAFRRKGRRVAPFKVGPDFIDPGHHTRITGTVSGTWTDGCSPAPTTWTDSPRASAGRDIALIEGVMGLYDGYDGRSDAGSTAQMAKWTGAPVVLIVDAKSMARSAAALVYGFERFDPDLDFAGVIFNNVGSPRHLAYLREALKGRVNMSCLGGIPRDDGVAIPERHLGLVTREEHEAPPETITRLADLVENHVDLDALWDRLPDLAVMPETGAPCPPGPAAGEAGVRIGVAADKAFCFLLSGQPRSPGGPGRRDRPFFPHFRPGASRWSGRPFISAAAIPSFLPTSWPKTTSCAAGFWRKSISGMPIYGECGGFMYLGREIRDTDGHRYPMTGCFPFATTDVSAPPVPRLP